MPRGFILPRDAYIIRMGAKSPIGEFEQLVLLAALHLGDDAYGVTIVDEVERRTGRSVSRSALYVTFDRLEEKGLLKSHLGDPTPGRGGRSKRYVTVTRAGVAALRESREALLEMWRGLESILERR